jgi:ribosomal protein S18 acetylase RimI-like enzyme
MVKVRAGDIQDALEVFARGFCFTRSFTHLCVAEKVESLWVVRDAPRTRGDYRREEWIAHGLSPREMDRVARGHTRGHFAICAICAPGEEDAALRAGFKELDYRLNSTEAVMVHDLKRIPRAEAPVKIARVLDRDLAQRVNKAAGARQILDEHLVKDAQLRQYVARVDEQLVGWVRSIEVPRGSWCSNMWVQPAFRRRGIARAMLCTMLRDDRAAGAERAVLTASHAGAKLYPLVGYREVGTLLLYTPKKH